MQHFVRIQNHLGPTIQDMQAKASCGLFPPDASSQPKSLAYSTSFAWQIHFNMFQLHYVRNLVAYVLVAFICGGTYFTHLINYVFI
jgi:hypothetical protein